MHAAVTLLKLCAAGGKEPGAEERGVRGHSGLLPATPDLSGQ